VILRYGAFYAHHAQSTLDSINLARRRLLPVPGRGANYVSSIHVGDAASATVAALAAPGGAYNVCDDEPLPMRQYTASLTDAFGFKAGRRVPVWLFKLLAGGPATYVLSSHRVSNARFKQATGWQPRYPSAREGYAAIADALA